jgi:hypothetical protein
MEPCTTRKKKKKTETMSTTKIKSHALLVLGDCDQLLTQAIFPFLSVNDQTNLCLTSKGMLAGCGSSRRGAGVTTSGADDSGPFLVWEERAPTKRIFDSFMILDHALTLAKGLICVKQEQRFRFQLQTVEFGHLVVRIHL